MKPLLPRADKSRSLLALTAGLVFASSASAQITTGLPFYDSFEGARPSPWWTIETTGAGDAQTTGAISASAGLKSLVLGATGNTSSTVDAQLALALAGETQVDLGFQLRSYNDSDDAVDGVWISDDGVNFVQAQALNSTTGVSTGGYTSWNLDLDQAAASAGMSLTTPFYVRLSWQGNLGVPNNGFSFDEFYVRRASSQTILVPSQISTIQGAIDAASNDDVILVAPGFYNEKIAFNGKAISVIGQDGSTVTTISGNLPDPSPSGPHDPTVRFAANEGRASQLIGFTITGTFTFLEAFELVDNAVGVWAVGADPTVRDCRMTGNLEGGTWGDGLFENCQMVQNGFASLGIVQDGGGVHGNPTLINCSIRDNDGRLGGGVYGAPTLVNTVVSDNMAWFSEGGGWYATGGVAYGSQFRNNVASDEHSGGGVMGPAHLIDTLVIGNKAIGGMACGSIGAGGIDGAAYVRNVTVIDNVSGCLFAGVYPGGIKNAGEVIQCIVWNNMTMNSMPGTDQVGDSKVSYSIVQGGFAGPGVFSADPLLGPTSLPMPGSPAIDAGHPGFPLEGDGTPMDLGYRLADAIDANQNGYPDYFEFALGAEIDCNRNGFLDSVDLGGVTGTDFDGDGNQDACVAPPLNVDVTELSLSAGGAQTFTLTSPQAGDVFVMIGSLSGTSPGMMAGALSVPLNVDTYTIWLLNNLSSPALTNFVGVISGSDTSVLTVPAGYNPSLVGVVANHAYVTVDAGTGAFTTVSNPVPLTFVP